MRRGSLVLLVFLLALPATAQPVPPDIRGHWAENRISALLARNIIDLGNGGRFQPDDPILRGKFIEWLVRAKGLPLLRPVHASFEDVPPWHPAFPYVETAVAFGLVEGGRRFLPEEAMTRIDGFTLVVLALGYARESAVLGDVSLPFTDTSSLPGAARGVLAVSILARPPLLREPPATKFRPFAPMTRAEAANLLWSYLQAIERGITLRVTTPIAPGVELVVEKQGALRAPLLWRVQIGAFQNQENALRLAEAMRAQGFPASVEFFDDFYKVRVGNLKTRREAEDLARRLSSMGLPTWIVSTVRDFEALPGPFWSGEVIITPGSRILLAPALANGRVIGRERTSAIARRSGAIAAVNGGFFHPDGDPTGCLMINGELISEPTPERTCMGITRDGEILFARLRFEGTVAVGEVSIPLDGINRARKDGELILYTSRYHTSTLTNSSGTEAIILRGTVQEILDGQGNSTIPPDGYVLSGSGPKRRWILENLRPGATVHLSFRLLPDSEDPRWGGVIHMIGGGPRLLVSGQYMGGEGFPIQFSHKRHPRTAVGVTRTGRVLLVVVDGRQPDHSLGMTLPELAALLLRLGVTDALNLDGGGSSTLVVRGMVVNSPSDETGERAVADALLVLPAGSP
ncbi:MAG: phosphodiester glycosidase family protein [Armatimonadota bacterium]|nr:phosphodiester glycosidase family protein [Armatimonadota bacterium]MDR5703053.1 phosphodiester glycosidase family protein [Armatimonadota bacterium]